MEKVINKEITLKMKELEAEHLLNEITGLLDFNGNNSEYPKVVELRSVLDDFVNGRD